MKKNEQLIEEINACAPDKDTAVFWWLGQLGYVVKLGSYTLYLDPYLSESLDRNIPPLLRPEHITNADYILGSHDHIDHIDREVWFDLSVSSPKAKFIVPEYLIQNLSEDLHIEKSRFVGLNDNMKVSLSDDLTISGVAAAHEFLDRDDQTGLYPYLGYVIEGNGCRLYHSGDTCIYEGLYTKLKNTGKLDVMFLPINGRDAKRYLDNIIGNMTYQEAVDLAGSLKPGLVVPGHYEMFDFNKENPLLFADYMTAKYPYCQFWIGKHGEKITYRVKSN